MELIPGGKDILVTRHNREEFVKLYIEYEFKKQCEAQFSYFRKGFERMINTSILKASLESEEL